MTFKAMGVSPAETARRQEVCNRINTLSHKKQQTEDPAKAKRIDRKINAVLRAERYWMKDVAFFLY